MSRDEQTGGEQLFERVYRRGVLRSVGAGAALSVGGYGLASQEDGEGETPTPTPTPTETGPGARRSTVAVIRASIRSPATR